MFLKMWDNFEQQKNISLFVHCTMTPSLRKIPFWAFSEHVNVNDISMDCILVEIWLKKFQLPNATNSH